MIYLLTFNDTDYFYHNSDIYTLCELNNKKYLSYSILNARRGAHKQFVDISLLESEQVYVRIYYTIQDTDINNLKKLLQQRIDEIIYDILTN